MRGMRGMTGKFRALCLTPLPFGDLNVGNTVRRVQNASVTMYKARDAPGMPVCLRLLMMDETLALKEPVWVSRAIRQGHFMVDGGDMLSWNTDLDHLDIVGGKQHTMPDFGWLNHAITRMQAKFRPLILIDEVHPARDAENQLKPDRVIMNHVRHRSAIRDADVAGND